MDTKSILHEAIKKANANGWQGVLSEKNFSGGAFYYPDAEALLTWDWNDNKMVFSDGEYDDYEEVRVEAIIYDHEFAKALWGTDMYDNPAEYFMYGLPKWIAHLEQLVIVDDPIKYLKDNMGVN